MLCSLEKCYLSVLSVVLVVFIDTDMFRRDCSSQPEDATSLPFVSCSSIVYLRDWKKSKMLMYLQKGARRAFAEKIKSRP